MRAEVDSYEITIGLFVFNGEKYLRETIDSILAQSYKNYKLVISDNASTDSTEEICRSISSGNNNIEYIRHSQNKGAIYNTIFLLKNCKTPYFILASDHDKWSENYLMKLLESLQSHPDAVLAYPDITTIDWNGRTIGLPKSSSDRWSTIDFNVVERFHKFIWQKKSCIMIYGLMRTQAAKQLISVPKILGMDNVMLAKLILLGDYIFVSDTEIFYRIHRSQEVAEQMWERQRLSLQVNSETPPWWRVCFEYCKLVLFQPSLKINEKIKIIDDLLWAMQKRFGSTLSSESKLLYFFLKIANKGLGILHRRSIPWAK